MSSFYCNCLQLFPILGVKYLDAMCVFFWATTPVMITLLSFLAYCFIYTSSSLTAAKIFTSLALFNMLIGPLNAMPWVSSSIQVCVLSVWLSIWLSVCLCLCLSVCLFIFPSLCLPSPQFNRQNLVPSGDQRSRGCVGVFEAFGEAHGHTGLFTG